MARTCVTAILTMLAIVLIAPAGAQARNACPAEQTAVSVLTAAEVGDAIFCLTNRVRAHYGLPGVHRDGRLDTAARLHSADMALRGFFSHTSPDGTSPQVRASAQGYALGVGENIAYGYTTARTVMTRWMASAGHCRNILSPARDLGVGVGVGLQPYYTQDFGDYFTRAVDEAPRGACPHVVDFDALESSPGTTPGGGTPPAADPSPAPAPSPQRPEGSGTIAGTATVTLGTLALSPRRFRAASGASTVSYTLSTAATVRFRVERELAGRRSGGRCVPVTRSVRRSRRCTRTQRLRGGFTQAAGAGTNTVQLTARLGGRRLKPGRYVLVAVAVGPDVAPPQRSPFTITR